VLERLEASRSWRVVLQVVCGDVQVVEQLGGDAVVCSFGEMLAVDVLCEWVVGSVSISEHRQWVAHIAVLTIPSAKMDAHVEVVWSLIMAY